MNSRHTETGLMQPPGRRLLQGIKLAFVREHSEAGSSRGVNASLNLTSFIDFLITIVVFLLMFFAASGEPCLSKHVVPPSAENTTAMVDAPLVSVQGNQVLLDGIPAGTTRGVEEGGRTGRIDDLARLLKAKRELWKQLNPGKAFPGVVVLQIDKRVPAVVVKSVFQTAALAGYPDVSFMVNQLAPSRNTGG